MVGRSLLSQDVPQAIQNNTSFHNITEIYGWIESQVLFILERIIISSFILLTTIKRIFLGIDSSGFKPTHASQYYTERSGLRKKWIKKLSVGGDMLKQIICTIKIRRAPSVPSR
jgi:hypothetical protein